MKNVTKVFVTYMHESCQRHTYWATIVNDQGQQIEGYSKQTGSLYNNFEGLTREQAREQILYHAQEWADFFGISLQPYVEDGVEYKPNMFIRRFNRKEEVYED